MKNGDCGMAGKNDVVIIGRFVGYYLLFISGPCKAPCRL